MDLSQLCETWLQAKQAEAMAVETRRKIEDQLVSLIGLPETFEGTENAEAAGGYRIKIVGRMTRKIDADKVQEIAAENGLTEHLSALFRWKPEMNISIWKSTDSSITEPLLDAITTIPGRPSFSITQEI